jgi:alkylation response protein AidB-like acyl-CoA dehydrogenase
MTDILARVLRMYAPHLAAKFIPLLTRTDGKPFQAAMFLTEKAGGSDVGANILKASRDVDGDWLLEGDKWFCSNCHADLILTLARPVGSTAAGTAGLALFLVPRVLENGQRNGYRVNRLKTKMGTRGLPSGEVTFERAKAYLVGEPGEGFHQMTEMLNQTRVANAIVSAAIVHRSWFEAINHAIGRSAFGKRLSDHPLMMDVLSNLLLECEGLTRLTFFVASQVDRCGEGSCPAGLVARTLTPLAKYHAARLAQWAAHEAMEVRGGNGYIEDWPNARLVRDAHLLSIWEGSGNIMVLDTGRALKRAGALEAVLADLNERVEQIFHPLLKPMKRALKTEIERFRELAIKAGVTRREEKSGDEEMYLRLMVDCLAHLYTTVLLAQDADLDLSEGDGRIFLLTIRYHVRHILYGGGRKVDPTLRETFYDVVSGRWLDPIYAQRLMDVNEVKVEK